MLCRCTFVPLVVSVIVLLSFVTSYAMDHRWRVDELLIQIGVTAFVVGLVEFVVRQRQMDSDE